MTQWTEDIISAEIAGTLDGLLYERVRRTPDTMAYRSYDAVRKLWAETSWNDVGRATARWQAALAAEELLPGERVALQLRNSKEWVYFDQAALACALVVVPLYTDDRPENIAYILRDSAARVLLVQDLAGWKRLAPLLKDYEELKRVLILNAPESPPEKSGVDERVRFVPGWLPERAHALVRRPGDPHALASIVYTSGTTGRPKGVMLSHYNMLSIAHAALTMIDVYQEDLFLSFLPLSHTLERTAGYYLPMMTGSTVAYARSVPQLAEDLLTIRPTVLIAVPRIFERVFVRIQGQLDKQSALARDAVPPHHRGRLATFRAPAAARRLAPEAAGLAAAETAGGGQGHRETGRAPAPDGQWRCGPAGAGGEDLHQPRGADPAGLRTHGDQSRHQREPAAGQRAGQRGCSPERCRGAHRRG